MIESTEEKDEALRGVAAEICDKSGMVMAACIQYLVMTEDGNERVGHYFTGGIINAIGLVQRANDQLLSSFYEMDEDEG